MGTAFDAIASSVQDVRETRKPREAKEAVAAIRAQILSTPALHSLSDEIDTLLDNVQKRSISRADCLRQLDKSIMPKVKRLSAQASSLDARRPTRFAEEFITLHRKKQLNIQYINDRYQNNGEDKSGGNKDKKVPPSPQVIKAHDSLLSHIRGTQDMRDAYRLMMRPYEHSKKCLDWIVSYAALTPAEQKALDKQLTFDTKPEIIKDLFLDEAMQVLLNAVRENRGTPIKSLLKDAKSGIQTNKYARKVFLDTRFNDGTFGMKGREVYKTARHVRAAVRDLIALRKEIIKDVRNIGFPLNSKEANYFMRRPMEYRFDLGEINKLIGARERGVASKDKYTNDIERLFRKYDHTIPKRFDEITWFNVAELPIAAEFGVRSLRDPEVLKDLGIDAKLLRLDNTKTTTTLILEEQFIMFFDRSIAQQMAEESFEDRVEMVTGKQEAKIKRTRKAIRDNKRQIQQYERDRIEVKPEQQLVLDKRIRELSATVTELETSLEHDLLARKNLKKQVTEYRKRNLSKEEIFQQTTTMIIDLINQRLTDDYVQMSSVPVVNPKNKDSVMVWLLPKRIHDRMEATYSNIRVREWTLPWQARPDKKNPAELANG